MTSDDHESPILVFVFAGKEWPRYVFPSLVLATKYADASIVVASNLPALPGLPGVEFLDIADFYDPQPFLSFAEKSALPAQFRDGFWLHTVERFFILEQFMRFRAQASVFHGELDCLFFGLPSLQRKLEASGSRGFFFPRESKDRGIGSLVYVNDADSLTELCNHFIRNAGLGSRDASRGNEMHLLGLTPQDSNTFFALPTAAALYEATPRNRWPIVSDMDSEVIDGAVLGRWYFGVDPRNTGGRGTRNRIQNQKYAVPFEYPMSELRFRHVPRTIGIQVRHEDSLHWRTVHCLHVHSKIHRKISPGKVRRLTRRLNAGRSSWIVLPNFSPQLKSAKRVLRHIRMLATSAEVRQSQIKRTSSRATNLRKQVRRITSKMRANGRSA